MKNQEDPFFVRTHFVSCFFVGSLNLDEIRPEPETEPDDGTILADDLFEKGGRDHRTEMQRLVPGKEGNGPEKLTSIYSHLLQGIRYPF